MQPRQLGWQDIGAALRSGAAMLRQARGTALAFAACFVLPGALLMGTLLALGWTPFLIPAAGAFMLIAPVGLAGFFGLARAVEQGLPLGAPAVRQGFAGAAPALWALALVCALLFMMFVTDAAILYAYMVGGESVSWAAWFGQGGIARFVLWGSVSGAVIAGLLFAVSALSVPLLGERRASLVAAVVLSIRIILGNFLPALAWGALLAGVTMLSVLLLPLLLLTLPWLAFASWALYRHVLPEGPTVDRV